MFYDKRKSYKDKFFPARSEITMSPLPKGHIARLATIHKVKAQ